MRDRPDCSYIPIKPEVLANFGRGEAAWHKPPAGGGSGSARERPRAADCSAYIGGKMLSFAFFLFLFISFESRLSGARPKHSVPGLLRPLLRQFPMRPRIMARVSVRIPLQIVLMLRFCPPEGACRLHFRHHFSGPESRGVDVRDCLRRHTLLLLARIKYP